jgi:3-hydroxyacyl-[acyl-carrier-protein] dehydratase
MTEDKWHSLECRARDGADGVVADALVEPGSPWFSGHFPGWPILPGIAMLSMVGETVQRDEHKRGMKVRITGVKRVRFRQPIRPDDPISISLVRTEGDRENSYNFKIVVRHDIACTGIMTAERIN